MTANNGVWRSATKRDQPNADKEKPQGGLGEASLIQYARPHNGELAQQR